MTICSNAFRLFLYIHLYRAIVQHGGLEPLVMLASDQLKDTPRDVQEKAAGCLANIACGKGNKHYVVRAGGLRPLLQLLRYAPLEQNENENNDGSSGVMEGQHLEIDSSGAVVFKSSHIKDKGTNSNNQSNGTNTSHRHSNNKASSSSSPSSSSSDVYSAQRQAARALFALSGLEENQRCIVEGEDGCSTSDGLECLINALSSYDSDVQQYSAGAIANIALGKYCGDVVRKGSVSLLLGLAKSSSLSVQKQAIRGLKNVFGDNKKSIGSSNNRSENESGSRSESESPEQAVEGKECINDVNGEIEIKNPFAHDEKEKEEIVIVPGVDSLSNEQLRMQHDMNVAYNERDETFDLYISIRNNSLSSLSTEEMKSNSEFEDQENGLHVEEKRIVRTDSNTSTSSTTSTTSSTASPPTHSDVLGVPCHWAILASSSTHFAALAKTSRHCLPSTILLQKSSTLKNSEKV